MTALNQSAGGANQAKAVIGRASPKAKVDLAYELSLRPEDVARSLLGEPNAKQSNRRELRYGTHGSFRVILAGRKRGRWNDFESGERGDLLDLIRREQRCSLGEACDWTRNWLGIRQDDAKPARPALAPKPKPEPEDDTARSRYSLRIFFNEAEPIIGSSYEVYFAERRIDLAAVPDLHGVLRWHPCCPWGAGGATRPCIIALWTDIISGAPRAIHRRPITAHGEKIDRWRALGPTLGCVIRLWSDDWVEQGLVLGEGIETTLTAATRIEDCGALFRAAWAAGDAGHMAAFPVLPGIGALTLLVDNDPLNPRTGRHPGQHAAAECAGRWRAAGREVTRLVPHKTGTDFADIVMREQPP
jgi:putative DNA primase/helicase